MRIAISVAVAVMALGSASQAFAADASTPFTGGLMTMHDAIASAPLLEANLGEQSTLFKRQSTLVGDQFAVEAPLRHRLGSQMMEYYPSASSGFHLSGGMRFFNVTNFNRAADKLTHNLLWSPTNQSFGSTRTGFKRKTPALTAGYTQMVANKLAFGLEAGTLLGRVNANMPRELGRTLSETGMNMKLNPVAAFTMGMKF